MQRRSKGGKNEWSRLFSLAFFLNLPQFLSPSLSLSLHDETSKEGETVREREREGQGGRRRKTLKIWSKKLHFILATPGGEPGPLFI